MGREVFLPRGVPAGPGFGIPVQDHGSLVGGQKYLSFLVSHSMQKLNIFLSNKHSAFPKRNLSLSH